MSISIYPPPVQTVIVSNVVETSSPAQMEALNRIATEERINNMYNYKKTDEDINKEDIEED